MKLEIDKEELFVMVELMDEATSDALGNHMNSAHPFWSLYSKVAKLARREFNLNYQQLELDLKGCTQSSKSTTIEGREGDLLSR